MSERLQVATQIAAALVTCHQRCVDDVVRESFTIADALIAHDRETHPKPPPMRVPGPGLEA